MIENSWPRRGAVVVALSVAFSLGGCSWFKRPVAYADSQEAGRLEVPGHLDRPGTDPALSVPAGGTGGVLLDEDQQKPPELGAITSNSGSEGLGQSSFGVAQDTGAVYGRIGTLLAGDPAYVVLVKDPVQGVYRITTRDAQGEGRRWWKFWSRQPRDRSDLVIRVSRDASGAGSDVSVGAATSLPAAIQRAAAVRAWLARELGAG